MRPWFARILRFSILACACFITLGDYFCYDVPGALGNEAVQKHFKTDALMYELLYSLYSWPNTVLAFLGGVLVDRLLGVRCGALLFTAIVSVAQLLLAVAF
jgi:MFS family permease